MVILNFQATQFGLSFTLTLSDRVFKNYEKAQRDKLGQMGKSGTNQDQIGPNGAKRGQTGLNGATGAKQGHKGLNRAKQGQTGLIFCMHKYFYERKKSCFATQALRQKFAELQALTKSSVPFLVLVRQIFFISSERLFIRL